MNVLTRKGKIAFIIAVVLLIIAIIGFLVAANFNNDYDKPIYVNSNIYVSAKGGGQYQILCQIKNLTNHSVFITELRFELSNNTNDSAHCTLTNITIYADDIYSIDGIYQVTDNAGKPLTYANNYTICAVYSCTINGETFTPAISSDEMSLKKDNSSKFIFPIICLIGALFLGFKPAYYVISDIISASPNSNTTTQNNQKESENSQSENIILIDSKNIQLNERMLAVISEIDIENDKFSSIWYIIQHRLIKQLFRKKDNFDYYYENENSLLIDINNVNNYVAELLKKPLTNKSISVFKNNINDIKYMIISFGIPKSITECSYILIAEFQQVISYFTVEKSIDADYVLCKWEENQHYNYGKIQNDISSIQDKINRLINSNI